MKKVTAFPVIETLAAVGFFADDRQERYTDRP